MDLDEYQRRAGATDQTPASTDSTVGQSSRRSVERDGPANEGRKAGVEGNARGTLREPRRHEVIPLLGLVGEVGGLLGEYKKLLRDGATHRQFRDEVAEQLGDILWYVANVATKFDLTLGGIAEQNLTKVQDRWHPVNQRRVLYDEHLPGSQQLPRRFEYSFEERAFDGVPKVVLVDRLGVGTTGDPLTDNAYDDDGYRFHDAIHLALAACLGWSPVLRKQLRKKNRLENRTPRAVDEVEDGGRAQVIEEAIVAAAYLYASRHTYLDGVETVDWQLLRHIKQLTFHVEVGDRSAKEWNDALLAGFSVWRKLRDHGGGIVRGDLLAGTIEFIRPQD